MTTAKKFLLYISQNYSFSVLRPIQKLIKERGEECVWFIEGNEVNQSFFSTDETILDSIEAVVDYKPDAVFIPGNVVPSFIPGLKVQVFHGLPSKKAKKNGQLYHYIIRGMFDLYCTQGPESTEKFNQLQSDYGFFHVAETGWSKLDSLFQDKYNKAKTERRAIFFASTFSPRFSKAEALYPLLSKMMKQGSYNWYLTLHPKMNHQTVTRYRALESDNVKFVEPTEFNQYFKKSDIMLCDTSSIIYEFLTQLKPVVTFQTETVEPCLINVESIEELEETLHKVIENPQTNQQNIQKQVSRFHPYQDGQSSKRVLAVVDEMLAGKHQPGKAKPANLLRNFKLRKKLGYWKI